MLHAGGTTPPPKAPGANNYLSYRIALMQPPGDTADYIYIYIDTTESRSGTATHHNFYIQALTLSYTDNDIKAIFGAAVLYETSTARYYTPRRWHRGD
jgi:hypothetical protein